MTTRAGGPRRRQVSARGGPAVPAWWRDAKLGIFVHWTPASVPGWAPVDVEIGDLMASGAPHPMASAPYTEWYQNSLRFPDSPVSAHHREVHPGRDYASFADDFRAGLETWDPTDWARRFRATGARYVVLVTKHHDGFCLWPSEVRNPHVDGWTTGRDVVGELAEAVRGEGLRFGVYYSGGLDWTFEDHPIGQFSDLLAALPGGDYPAYADAQVRELIARYRPDVLWGDIMWPGDVRHLRDLVLHYRRAVPDGVVNDRFLPRSRAWPAVTSAPARRAIDLSARRSAARHRGIVPPRPPIYDVRSPEYTVRPDIDHEAWECVRGLDKSFGFNRASDEDHFLPRDELVWSFLDIVAKGGNLLVNVGPRGTDAQIPDPQLRRLDWLADAVGPDSPGVAGTRPWVEAGTTTADGHEVRLATDAGAVVVAVRGAGPDGELTVDRLRAGPAATVEALGGGTASVADGPDGLRLRWQGGADGPAARFRVHGAVAAERPAPLS